MAIFGIPVMIAPALGPIIGGYLVTYWSWRLCFYVNIPVIAAALLVAQAWLGNTQVSLKSFDLLGFILGAIGLGSILYAFSYVSTWHWNDWRIITLLIVGTIFLVSWILIELRQSQPLLDMRIFKNWTFTLSAVLFSSVIAAFYAVIFLIPLFLENLRGLNAMQTGMLLVSSSIGTIVAMVLCSAMYQRFGPRLPVILGLALMGITGLWLQNMDTTTSDVIFQWMMFWRGLGAGLSMMPAMNCALSSVPENMSAQASSTINVIQQVTISMIVAIFATLLDNFQKTSYAVMIQTATMNSSAILSWVSYIQASLMQAGQTAEVAYQTALAALYEYFILRSTITAFQKDFFIIGLLSLISILPSFLLPHGRTDTQKAGAFAVA